MSAAEHNPRDLGMNGVPKIPDTAGDASFARIVGRDPKALRAERMKIFPRPVDELLLWLDQKKFGAAIKDENATDPTKQLVGYIIPDNDACLVIFNNGDVYKGAKIGNPGYTQQEFESEIYGTDTHVTVTPDMLEEDGCLSDKASYAVMTGLYIRGVHVLLSNRNPKQIDELELSLKNRIRLLEEESQLMEGVDMSDSSLWETFRLNPEDDN